MPESSGHNPSTRVRTVCLSLHELCLATKTPLPLQAYAEKGASDPPPPPPSPPPAHRMKISKERFFTSSKRRTTLIWNKPEKGTHRSCDPFRRTSCRNVLNRNSGSSFSLNEKAKRGFYNRTFFLFLSFFKLPKVKKYLLCFFFWMLVNANEIQNFLNRKFLRYIYICQRFLRDFELARVSSAFLILRKVVKRSSTFQLVNYTRYGDEENLSRSEFECLKSVHTTFSHLLDPEESV